MRSLFYDIHRIVVNTVERAGYSVSRILSMPGISRSWYYLQLLFSPILDRRFNPMAIRNYDEWIVNGFKHQHPVMSFMEIAYTMIDEDIAYLSPSTVYRILRKHNLITPWNRPIWESTRPDHAKTPNERWQTEIMYIKIREDSSTSSFSLMSTAGTLFTILFSQQWMQIQYQWKHRLLLTDSGKIQLQNLSYSRITDHHSSPGNSG